MFNRQPKATHTPRKGLLKLALGAVPALGLMLGVAVAAAPQHAFADGPYGVDTCAQGYVWREAVPGDHVCVTPDVRSQAQYDNSQAAARRAGGGAYGPDTCLNGYVWREVIPGDHVCVTPATRDQVQYDNSQASSRLAGGSHGYGSPSLRAGDVSFSGNRVDFRVYNDGTADAGPFDITVTGDRGSHIVFHEAGLQAGWWQGWYVTNLRNCEVITVRVDPSHAAGGAAAVTANAPCLIDNGPVLIPADH